MNPVGFCRSSLRRAAEVGAVFATPISRDYHSPASEADRSSARSHRLRAGTDGSAVRFDETTGYLAFVQEGLAVGESSKTASNRIARRLDANRRAGGGTLLPYLTAGFPDAATTAALVVEADRAGAGVVEIGFPYSDSIADGPVIQASFHYALANGHRVEDAFRLVAEVRSKVTCGLVAMVSYSIVSRIGLDGFMDRAAAVGFDGVILPDVPIEESPVTAAAAGRAGLCHVGLVAPSTSTQRRRAIAESSTGFIYQIAAAGTTGERSGLPPGLAEEVGRLRSVSGVPVCVGFGVRDADQVREVCRFADGAIVGSAIVRRIDEGIQRSADPDEIVSAVGGFLRSLATGLHG